MSRLLIPNTTQVPNVLLDLLMPALKNTSLRVSLAVVRFTYGFQKQADKISLTQLQRITGLSRQGVVDGVAALGPLLKIKPGARGRGANEYSLNLDVSTGQLVNHFDQSTILTSQNHGSKVVNAVDSSKPIRSKPIRHGAKAPHSRLVLDEEQKSGVDQQLLADPTKKPHTEGKRKLTRPAPAPIGAFETWYASYPKHVGRKPAMRAWTKLNPDSGLVETITAATARYVNAKAGVEVNFILDPATWLNQERWTDETFSTNGAGNGHGKTEIKDLGDGFVEVDGRRMDRQTAERRYGKTAI